MVGQVGPAVDTAIGAVALVGQVRLERFHHGGGAGQTSNGLAGNFEVQEGAEQANE